MRRGSSEFSIYEPKFGILEKRISKTEYPEGWQEIEDEFDIENGIKSVNKDYQSLKQVTLHDLLIIEKWIDYAKGIGDPTAQYFADKEIKYPSIYQAGKDRKRTFTHC